MKKLNFDCKIQYKDRTFTIRNNSLYEGKTRIDHQGHAVLNNHLIAEYRKHLNKMMPKNYFTDLTFDKLVTETKYLIAAKSFLLDLKGWNCGGKSSSPYSFVVSLRFRYGRSSSMSTYEKYEAEINTFINLLIHGHEDKYYSKWYDKKGYTQTQKWVLDEISDHHLGHKMLSEDSDLNDYFDVETNSTRKIKAIVAQFKKFNFTKYGIKKAEILALVKKAETKTNLSIDTFRAMIKIAGNDLVNWGPHMVAARAKKHDIKCSYPVNWWLDNYKKTLKAKGVKLAPEKVADKKAQERKEDLSTRLRAMKVGSKGKKLSQDELVICFKNKSENEAEHIVELMTLEAITTLFEASTKNVTGKFKGKYGRNNGSLINAIVARFTAEKNDVLVKKLVTWLNTKIKDAGPDSEEWQAKQNGGMEGYYTLEFLIQYPQLASRKRLMFCTNSSSYRQFEEITDAFFNQCLKDIPVKERYHYNTTITKAFLDRATAADKKRFLDMKANDKEYKIQVYWQGVADVFKELPYKTIRAFIQAYRSQGAWRHFKDLIIENEDKKLIKDILTDSDNYTCQESDWAWAGEAEKTETVIKFFSYFDLKEKIEILNHRSTKNITKIISKFETAEFLKRAIEDESLSHYLEDFFRIGNISKAEINKLIAGTECPTLSSSFAEDLTQDNLIKVHANHGWNDTFRSQYSDKTSEQRKILERTFAPMTREAVFKAYDEYAPYGGMYNTHLLVDKEIRDIAEGDYNNVLYVKAQSYRDMNTSCFTRVHLSKIPDDILANYHDKANYKALVGDRRDRKNDAFGSELDIRLSIIPKPVKAKAKAGLKLA